MYKSIAIVSSLFAIAPMSQAIELTDFTEPNTSFDEAYLDFSATANSGNQDQASYSSFVDAFYNSRTSTERRVWGVDLSGNGSAARGPNDGDSTESDFGFSAGFNTDVYFSEQYERMFYFGAGSYAHQDSAIDDNIGVTVGLGYGRVWNATPLAKALRIQEALKGYGLLTTDLSDEDLLNLAAVIGRENEYRAREGADEYRGIWYADMEDVLVAAGVLPDGELSALGTVKLDDVLFDEPISTRRHGWLVRGGAGFQSSDFLGITDNDPKLLFEAEYAKPYGLRGQLLNTTTYEPIFGDNVVQRLSNTLSYSHEISDRIDWINSWQLSHQQADDDDDTRFTTNTLTSSFAYYLSNRLNLGLTLSAVDTNDSPNLDDSNDDIATAAILGLRYRLK